MKLQQLRYICEVAKHGLNISSAAENLYTSQPGISKQIRQLEDELGLKIFERKGKHLSEITTAGSKIIELASSILETVENIKNVSKDFNNANSGTLSIATTHTQARYILPAVVKKFTSQFPNVSLRIHQGTPTQISELVSNRLVDFGIATEDLSVFGSLVRLPCFKWTPLVVVPTDHELMKLERQLTLTDVIKYPIITYLLGFNARTKMDIAFQSMGLKPNIVLDAVDTDVIKTYVRLGFGIGIIASPAYDKEEDSDLVALLGDGLYEGATTEVIIKPGAFLRGYMYAFLKLLAPHLTSTLISETIQSEKMTFSVSSIDGVEIPSY